MDWKKFWDKSATENSDDVIGQVQRKDVASTMLTVNHIVRNLEIKPIDKVLDVCCGNGIITQLISLKCDSIVGVDQSENLLKTAENDYKELNISYVNCSAKKISKVLEKQSFDKIYLQFSFQYFDKKNEGKKVIKELLKCLKPNGKIFIGDITNHHKMFTFFNTPMKKLRYLKHRIEGRNGMGKFWKVSELDAICKTLNVKGTFLQQPKELPYAYYRFDYLIEN